MNSLAKRTYATAIEAYQDRISEAEAFALVGILLGQFPNCKGDDIFLRTLATLLMGYPRETVAQIADPQRGVAAQERFLGVEAVSKWCDNRSESLAYAADWEGRAHRTVKGRNGDPEPSQALHIKTMAWLDRDDPKARMLAHGTTDEAELKALDEAEEERLAQKAAVAKNRAVRARLAEYEAAGLEPVYADKNREIPLSLPFLLANGWTVEETPEGKRLARP